MDIFDKSTQKGEFVKLKVKGDSVQGTYIDMFYGKDSFDNDQVVYVLKDKDNKVWNVAFKLTNRFMLEDMSKVRFGQIVGFRVDDVVESKQRKGIMVKYIHAYHDIKSVDAEWIKEQTAALALLGTTIAEDQAKKMDPSNSAPRAAEGELHGNWDDEPPFPNTPAEVPHSSANTDDTLSAIRVLATNKGLVPAGADAAVADALIEGYVGMPITAENYTKVIVKLSSFTK